MNSIAPVARPVVAVIGGGVSGAAFALHLVRDHPALSVDIVLIEPRALLGAGLAYSTTDPQHRINVSAARMALFAEDPAHFARWFAESGEASADPAACVGAGVYPTRAAFGRYLNATLAGAVAGARAARFRHIRDLAVAMAPEAAGFRVVLAGGGTLRADLAVLATGHPAAEPPAALRALAGHPSFVANPWASDALTGIAPQARVLIVGTGLTMTDVLASLRAGGHRGPVVALSRRSLLPRPRTTQPVEPRGMFVATTARELLRQVRAEIESNTRNGLPWENVIDALRQQGRAIWRALPPDERRRLLRHAQPYWDVHRYQSAPQIAAVLGRELATGGLRVVAASVRGGEALPDGTLRLHVHPRGRPDAERIALDGDVVVTCTGPAHRLAVARNPLLRALSDAGLIRPDRYGLGIETDEQGRAIASSGQPLAALLVAGPPARGTWGELMGLPQVSGQPRELAAYAAVHFAHSRFIPAQEANA